jgi:hypothetical protein
METATLPSIVNRKHLPVDFPTHAHTSEFWQELGRVVATFGFLEEILGKAIFAFTATRSYEPGEVQAAYQAWLPQLERALTDQLGNLTESFGKAVRDNPAATITNIDELLEDIKSAVEIRNVLCHGSWRPPDASGASVPLYVSRKKEIFDKPIDIAFLRQVRTHVVELVCSVIDTVTYMGYQFPGSNSPGKPIG